MINAYYFIAAFSKSSMTKKVYLLIGTSTHTTMHVHELIKMYLLCSCTKTNKLSLNILVYATMT